MHYKSLTILIAVIGFILYKYGVNKILDKDNYRTETGKKFYSSVWCHYDEKSNKFCKFKNLCFLPKTESFIFILRRESVIYGIKSKEDFKNISLSSVEDHNDMFMKISLFVHNDLTLKTAKIINEPTLFIKRFKWDNILHVIHDDIFPIFMTYSHMCAGDVEKCTNIYNIAFVDKGNVNIHTEWYSLLSKSKPTNINSYNEITCFGTSYVGLSRKSIWFQYGFKKQQGPVIPSYLDGIHFHQFRKFILNGFNLSCANQTLNEGNVAFFNRKLTRKILNEKFVLQKISNVYLTYLNFDKELNIFKLDPSQNDSREILSAVCKSKLLIGMHGSAMIYSIFLPQKSGIIELFPFGIQPQHVSPIRALFNLPEMDFVYLSWRNFKENNSISFPERPALHGGISGLPIRQQENIKELKLVPAVECCHNPAYLYRMFQDTIVDDSIEDIIKQIITNKKELEEIANAHSQIEKWFYPGPVYNVSCKLIKLAQKILISWEKPLNVHGNINCEYHLDVQVMSRVITMTSYTTSVYIMDENVNESQDIQVWIKCVAGSTESTDVHSYCTSGL